MFKIRFLMIVGMRPGWYITKDAEVWSPICYENPWLATLELERTHPEHAAFIIRDQLGALV